MEDVRQLVMEGAKVQKDRVKTETLATKGAKQTFSETESEENENATLRHVVSIWLIEY